MQSVCGGMENRSTPLKTGSLALPGSLRQGTQVFTRWHASIKMLTIMVHLGLSRG